MKMIRKLTDKEVEESIKDLTDTEKLTDFFGQELVDSGLITIKEPLYSEKDLKSIKEELTDAYVVDIKHPAKDLKTIRKSINEKKHLTKIKSYCNINK